MIETETNGTVTYGIEVRQKSGEWLPASTGRTRDYVDNMFQQYVANGEVCRIVDSEGMVGAATPVPEYDSCTDVVEDSQAEQSSEEAFAYSKAHRKQPVTIDLSRTRFIVTAWPDNRWPVEVYAFIELMMANVKPHRQDYRVPMVKQDRSCARNTAIRDLALKAPDSYDWFVFIDHDVRPHVDTPAFLYLESDVKSCDVPMRVKTAWSRTYSFHDPLWCTSRRVLEAIKPPWFVQGYTADGCDMDGCICQSFRDKVKAAGFSIAHGGWAEHDQDGSWC